MAKKTVLVSYKIPLEGIKLLESDYYVIYPEKVRINLDYFYNNSIWIDFKIIFATIFRISN